MSPCYKRSKREQKLPDDFTPGPLDVICARGKVARDHTGNKRYQKIIETFMDRYVKAQKLTKMSIISEIVHKVRLASPDGGFVKEKGGCWYEVGDDYAREKVSQSLRDSVSDLGVYRSSQSWKNLRRSFRKQAEKKAKEMDAISQLRQKGWLVEPPTTTRPVSPVVESQLSRSSSLLSAMSASSSSSSLGNMALYGGIRTPSPVSIGAPMATPSLSPGLLATQDLLLARLLLARQAQTPNFVYY